MKEWPCSHILQSVSNPSEFYYKEHTDYCGKVPSDVLFCDKCGTPRPEPKKGLAEKIREKRCASPGFKLSYGDIAKTALEHFSEIVDEFCGDSRSFTARELKKKFMESL